MYLAHELKATSSFSRSPNVVLLNTKSQYKNWRTISDVTSLDWCKMRHWPQSLQCKKHVSTDFVYLVTPCQILVYHQTQTLYHPNLSVDLRPYKTYSDWLLTPVILISWWIVGWQLSTGGYDWGLRSNGLYNRGSQQDGNWYRVAHRWRIFTTKICKTIL
jgi:hypothetical protein